MFSFDFAWQKLKDLQLKMLVAVYIGLFIFYVALPNTWRLGHQLITPLMVVVYWLTFAHLLATILPQLQRAWDNYRTGQPYEK